MTRDRLLALAADIEDVMLRLDSDNPVERLLGPDDIDTLHRVAAELTNAGRLRTFNVSINVTLPVIAANEDEAVALMADHWVAFPPSWLHLRSDEYVVSEGNDADAELAINAGRYQDDLD